MKAATPQLIALLNSSNQFQMADLLTLALRDGTVLRYTSADLAIVWGGNTFGTDMLFQRGRIRSVIGVEVDTLEMTLYPSSANILSGVSFLRALTNGALDGADVTLDRAFLSAWGTPPVGVLRMFSGRVAESVFSRTQASLSVVSDTELLNVKLPRNLYQAGCVHTLYDVGCTLLKSAFAVASTVASGSTRTIINCGVAQASAYFDQGTILFTSGPNAGAFRSIKKHVSGSPAVITLAYPLLNDPVVGNGFTAHPGCDKQQATCESKFNNRQNFRGFPYVPVPETAL